MSSNSTKGKEPRRETIELEEEDARVHRIERLLEKLNTASSSSGASIDPASIFNGSAISTGEGSGQSIDELLARVRAFLPEMEASNAELATRAAVDPRSIDIENVEGDEEVIQMKLGLGVFEEKTGRESEDDSSTDEDSEDDSDEDSDESSSSEDSSSESSEREYAPLPQRAILSRAVKPLPRRARPEIVVLSETQNEGQ
ncbi:hypothetical protein FB45DRAFT_475524 [Roridomyces roridus]|uniref:Uncharacterized protein n=1 Tax=Roridomyces roridus TaxID=1738132 RepID=A0AAD7BZH6_9AGAR|nr:hypothetical protein FB45DRAFT_475524 [Roridomyces roridus]